MNQIFVVGQASEKYIAKGNDVYWALMNLKEAYDIENRDMWNVLRLCGLCWSRW